jgi:hypothetical protein
MHLFLSNQTTKNNTKELKTERKSKTTPAIIVIFSSLPINYLYLSLTYKAVVPQNNPCKRMIGSVDPSFREER